ncbi:MAG: hypothetical protein NVSMB9_25990 [Isosphaeraceae bacterium]
MCFPKKAAALIAGFVLAIAATQVHPLSAAPNAKGEPETLIVDEATIAWIERANVAALREGVVDRMELTIGMPVAKGKPIGYLHAEMADLAVKKAEIAVRSKGPKAKAKAQKDLALAKVAIDNRLNSRIKGSVSFEEVEKDKAELNVAEALLTEAVEKIELDEADLKMARRSLEEHKIVAPFDGIVTEVIKQPGESVRANEAVVKLGKLNRLRAFAYVSLEYAYRVKEGQIVEFQPKLVGERHSRLPIEQKRFRGKITFVDPQIQAVAETAVRVHAEFENKDLELRPGLKGTMTIYLQTENANEDRAAAPAVGARSGQLGVGR